MNIVKTVIWSMVGFIAILFMLLIKMENPEIVLYKETIKELMLREGLSTEQEIVDCYPQLNEIQVSMKKIVKLKLQIVNKARNSALINAESERLLLSAEQSTLLQLQKEIRIQLERIQNF